MYASVESESGSTSIVHGIVCSLCQCHRTKQRNGIGTWTDKPCTLLRKDCLQRHKTSNMHRQAEELALQIASQHDGGIVQAFSVTSLLRERLSLGL